jgi:hypothetical protein
MAVWPPRRLARWRVTHMARASSRSHTNVRLTFSSIVKPGILRNLHLWHTVGRTGKDLWVFSAPGTAFPVDMDPVPPIKLITYSTVPGPSASPTQNALSRTLSKAIKMHAKRTLFNYGKIIVITRPLPSTIPLHTLFSQPSCLTLQLTTPLTITNFPTSSMRVPNRRGTQTPVSPSFPLHSSPTIDKTRPIPFLVLIVSLFFF